MCRKTFTQSLFQKEGFEIWGAPPFLITVVKGYCHRRLEYRTCVLTVDVYSVRRIYRVKTGVMADRDKTEFIV